MAQHTSHPLELPVGKTMLDAVMFAASLVSKTSDIDTQLDRVRAITAQRTSTQLTKEDDKTLHEVYTYIEDYLVTKESLRAFTHESVRKRIQNYLTGGKQRQSLAKPLSVMWAVVVIGALAAFLAPDTIVSDAVKPTLAITIIFATIDLAAAWMFWSGLRNFKDEIRKAYLPICLGVALLGLTLVQVPFAVLAGQDTSVWFHYISSGIAIPAANMLLYLGIRQFARIGGIKQKLLSAKLVTLLCISIAVLIILLPKPDTGVPDWALSTSLVILMTGALLAAVTARITFAVRQALSRAYTWPMTWFMIFLIISALSCVQYAYLQLVATAEQPYDPRGIGLFVLVASALITLKAGTSFRRIDTSTSK